MRIFTAIKAFFKALVYPKQMRQFFQELGKEPEDADVSHLKLLGTLQGRGRLIDFLKEDIADFDDAAIGAAVRKIHEDCHECLEELIGVRAVMEGEEGDEVTIPEDYDAREVRITGRVKGSPPYKGVLIHRGWRALRRSLPRQSAQDNAEIICSAEVEVK